MFFYNEEIAAVITDTYGKIAQLARYFNIGMIIIPR